MLTHWIGSVNRRQGFGPVFIFPDPDPAFDAGDQGFNDQKLKKMTAEKKIKFFFSQKLQFTYP
jgi:hypothetical protein